VDVQWPGSRLKIFKMKKMKRDFGNKKARMNRDCGEWMYNG
jgi:hypothetical protein